MLTAVQAPLPRVINKGNDLRWDGESLTIAETELPSAEQVVFDGCGHVPQVERPEHTNGLLDRFFARVDALGRRGRRLEAA